MTTTPTENSELSLYEQGFRANLALSPQQTDTKLLETVDSDLNYSTPGQMFNADDVGESEPEDAPERVAPTPDKYIGVTRRIGFFGAFDDSCWFPTIDKARELQDPSSAKMSALMAGRWRRVDRTIMTGLLGGTYEMQDNSGAPVAVAYDTTNQQILANDVSYSHDAETVPDDNSDYGMSTGKLIHAGLILDESELEGDRYFAWSSKQKAELLRTTPVTSDYYRDVKALVNGQINEFLGFKFKQFATKRMLAKSGNNRRCIAWIKGAGVYRGRPITQTRVQERADMSYNVQAYYKAEEAFARRYDSAVVEVLCKET